jgi:assimilatory nitrate reductase catalytic subunit
MMEGVRTICPFCSMGCSLRIRPRSKSPYVGDIAGEALEYDADGPFNRGSLCGKGNMSLELLLHPGRLDAPRLAVGGETRRIGWPEAIETTVSALEGVRAEYGAEAIGIALGPHLTNEEVRRAIGLAHALGTPNIDGGLPEDRALAAGVERSCARPRPIETPAQIAEMTAILVLGDLFTHAPCISRPVLDSRYDRRRNVLAVLGARANRTSWFGRPVLRCQPTGEAAALALMLRLALEAGAAGAEPDWVTGARRALGRMDPRVLGEFSGLAEDRLGPVVEALRREPGSGVIVSLDFGETDRPDLVAGLAAMLAEITGSRFLPMPAGPNANGLRQTLAAGGYPARRGLTSAEMLEAAVTGDLKALIGFSCNPLAAMPGRMGETAAQRLAFFAYSAPLPDASMHLAPLVLPCATWGEKAGTVTNTFGADQVLTPALAAPGAARSDLQILDLLLERIAAQPHEVLAKAGDQAPCQAAGFHAELEFHLQLEQRERGAREVGSHLLLPEALASHAADGWLTHHFSWPRHEAPRAELALSAKDAAELGIAAGDDVRVRSRAAETVLAARIVPDVPAGAVLGPPYDPAVRALMRWRLDPALRDLDLRPSRVSVEPVRGGGER